MNNITFNKFVICTQLWGDEFLNFFLDYSLPSFMTKGNLFCGKTNFLFLIYTTDFDKFRLVTNETINFIKSQSTLNIDIEFRIIDQISILDNKYNVMTDVHRLVIQEFIDYPIFFFMPDQIFSNSVLANIIDLVFDGYRAIYVPSFRTEKQKIIPRLEIIKRNNVSHVINLDPRTLVTISLECLHQITISCFADGNTVWPSHVYFVNGNKGMIAICAHIHPQLIWVENKFIEFDGSTIDANYPFQAVSQEKSIAIHDSDHFITVEASDVFSTVEERNKPLSPWRKALWAYFHTNKRQRIMMAQPYYIKGLNWELIDNSLILNANEFINKIKIITKILDNYIIQKILKILILLVRITFFILRPIKRLFFPIK